ncbi:MAG: carboxypeptidase-like regulatory domain-containing protein [Capnocytophaga sp.]|nr:carboxypeptidase-like regulatory domain-containing protein [Capnocytophaga sp.]
MLRFLLFFAGCLVAMPSYGQFEVSGKVSDASGAVERAVVLVKNAGNPSEIAAYGVTDASGKYSLTVKTAGDFIIECNHISYEVAKKPLSAVENQKKYTVDFLLQETQNTLDEVVVIGESLAMRSQGDTLSYNVKAFSTGAEKNLKDVLRRLPGIDVDEGSGKILADGKPVDKLLVDGDDFFGNNHRLATENMPSAMVSGVDLYRNYTENKALQGMDETKKTAINIKIDEAYKGKITGNATAMGAYKDRYKLGTSLFRLDKKSKMSFVGNANNTNEEIMSAFDFYEMTGGIKRYARQSDARSDYAGISIPSFLLANDNLSANKTAFGALNFSFTPSAEWRISGFSLLNHNQSRGYSHGTNTFLDGASLSETANERERFLAGQSLVNITYTLSDRSFWEYSIQSSPGSSGRNLLTDRIMPALTDPISERNDNFRSQLDQQLTYTNRLSPKALLLATAYYTYDMDRSDMNLRADLPKLGQGNELSQHQRSDGWKSGIYAKYSYKPKKLTYSFAGEYHHTERSLATSLLGFASTDGSSLSQRIRDFSVLNSIAKQSGFFQYSVTNKLTFLPDMLQEWHYLPSASAKLAFSNSSYVNFGYQRRLDYVPLQQSLVSSYFLRDYLTLYGGGSANPLRPMPENVFSMDFLHLHLFSGTYLYGGAEYRIKPDAVTQHTETFADYTQVSFLHAPDPERSLTAYTNAERRIKPLKMRLKGQVAYVRTELVQFFDNQAVDVLSKTITPGISLISNFSKKHFNFQLGTNMSLHATDYGSHFPTVKMRTYTPYVQFDGKLGNVTYTVKNTYLISKNSNSSREFLRTNFDVAWQLSVGEIFLKGDDIFNIESTEIIRTSVSNGIVFDRVLSRIPGYLGAGFRYVFK